MFPFCRCSASMEDAALLAQEFGCGSSLAAAVLFFLRWRPKIIEKGDPKIMKKIIALLLSLVLLLSFSGCDAIFSLTKPDSPEAPENAVTFTFVAVNPEGKESRFEITTTKSTVGEALVDEGLIAGEQGDYGMYIKTVNGITLDYSTDGMYWAFYENDQYALAGVDQTPINPDVVYMIKAEKA